MPQSNSKQKPTSPSATSVSSDKDIGEGLWLKRNAKFVHQKSPSEENISTSQYEEQSIQPTEQSATMACDIAGNDHVSILPRAKCYSDDPDKARELATSTGLPGIQVYPAFFHTADSQIINAVDASRKSDEPSAEMETQASLAGAADDEIESQTPVRTLHLTGVSDSNGVTDPMDTWDLTQDVPVSSGFCNWKEGNLLESSIEGSMSPSSDGVSRAKSEQQTGEQSKMRQGGVGTMAEPEKLPAGSGPEIQNLRPRDIEIYAHSVNASNSPEVHGTGEVAQHFNPINFPVNWGTEEGIDINSLLGDIADLDKMGLPEASAPLNSDSEDLSRDNASQTVCWPGSCKFGQLFVHQIGTSLNDLFDQSKDCGGMDANHGLPPWTKNSSGVTGGPSAKDTTYSNEERLSTSSVQLTGLRPTPSPRGDLNLSQRVSLSAVGHAVTAGDHALPDVKPAMQVGSVSCLTPMSITSGDNRATPIPSKTQIGPSQLRPLPMNADGPEKIELPEPYSVFNSDRDDLPQDNTTPTVRGSEARPDSGNIGQLSIHELDTSLSDLFHQTKAYGGTDANNCLPPMSKFVSEHGTEETMARNNTQPETGGSSSTTIKVSSASVSKLCTPPSATTDIQVELAVETSESRDDSEANEAPEMCGNDVDFDLNCGARKITKEDYVSLGLHNLSWAKMSDATKGPPPMTIEDLCGLENAPKDSPLLVGDAIDGHDTEVNVSENKTRIDIGDSQLPANVDSLRNMKDPPSLVHFFGVCGPQESPGDVLPGSSPMGQPPKANDASQTVDSAKTLDLTSSDRANESS